VTFDEMETALRQRLKALPAPFGGHPETRTFGELLIDLEEDKAARAVVFGLLMEMDRKKLAPHGEPAV
jgi:hypothetical protein